MTPFNTDPKIKLTPVDREWIERKWAKIREAQKKADEANNDWVDLNRAINDKFDAEGITDPVARADRKGSSLALRDALATGNWHARNAERHIHDVNLFLRLRELGIK